MSAVAVTKFNVCSVLQPIKSSKEVQEKGSWGSRDKILLRLSKFAPNAKAIPTKDQRHAETAVTRSLISYHHAEW